jgi:hypothetical protein
MGGRLVYLAAMVGAFKIDMAVKVADYCLEEECFCACRALNRLVL